MLYGEAFRTHTLLFSIIWLLIPLFSCLMGIKEVFSYFDAKCLRNVRVAFMVLVVAISVSMMFDFDHVRNSVGKRYVEGYESWRGDTDVDDNGQEYYTGDEWTARNRLGRWGLKLLSFGSLIGCFLFPTVTYKATTALIHKREELDFLEKVEREDLEMQNNEG